MHLRDMRVLEFIRSRASIDGVMKPVRVSMEEIAEEVCCHRNTASAIVSRLVQANMLIIVASVGKARHTYWIPSKIEAA